MVEAIVKEGDKAGALLIAALLSGFQVFPRTFHMMSAFFLPSFSFFFLSSFLPILPFLLLFFRLCPRTDISVFFPLFLCSVFSRTLPCP